MECIAKHYTEMALFSLLDFNLHQRKINLWSIYTHKEA